MVISRIEYGGQPADLASVWMELTELKNREIAAEWSWPSQTAAYALLLNRRALSSLLDLPAAITERMSQIVVCDLSLNHMTAVPASIPSIATLRRLNLSCNLLTTVNIQDHPSLVELDLSQNLISSVHLAGLPQLRKLDISTNELAGQLSDLYLSQLSVLNIANNAIASLPHLASVQDLVADHNRIQDLNMLPTLSRLTSLSVSSNQIDDLEAAASALRQAPSTLKVLNLRGNPIATLTAYRMTIVDAAGSLERFDERPIRPFIRERLIQMKERDDLARLLQGITLSFTARIEREQIRLRKYVAELRRLEHEAQMSFERYCSRMEMELQETIVYIQTRKSAETSADINKSHIDGAGNHDHKVDNEGAVFEKLAEEQYPPPFVNGELLSADEVKRTVPEQNLQAFKSKSKTSLNRLGSCQ